MRVIDEDYLNRIIEAVREVNSPSYWCRYCKRSLPLEDGIYIHDDVFHPDNYTPECGGDHRLH